MATPSPGDEPPTVEDLAAASRPASRDQEATRLSGAGGTAAPARLGRYRILGRLGAGSFGVVFKAFDEELRRHVAVKVPHRERVTAPGDIDLYLAEARTLASLDHPGIVPVYDVGRTDDGLCYVVSKFIEGSDLRATLAQGMSLRQAAELVARVADALHHAHQRGLVHRDVKPANILLDPHGNPVVTDFGLALREEDFGTGPASAGTPGYMSPEQARGEGHRVDGRSDVYSLGVVLYELLTGRRPFVANARSELLELIKLQEPRPPRQLSDNVPRELDRICLKALAKRASDRFSTARDLADDLRNWLAGEADRSTELVGPPGGAVALVREKEAPGGPAVSDTQRQTIAVMPKGFRSFDATDADFFLELLPGPRDRDRLPESVRFWRTRLAETDPDKTFPVGVLYGPSGSGKSSLVRAGLLPRLPRHVVVVYAEAAPQQTEARLLHGLVKRCPGLAGDRGLAEALKHLRRGRGLAPGSKVLLVLDQFEQWLHADGEDSRAALVEALRQCDGGSVQALLLVRDDFWMATTHFMRDVEVPLREGDNSAAIDLFNLRHARKVLAAFGRAFGALPTGDLDAEQEAFLERAVAGLADEGKVIPVRLSLFAEMVKDKPWVPATLKDLGGTEGVGVAFLERTFSASTAPPEHRLHQRAARAVLQVLLPARGSDLKGHLRSRQELLAASGYAGRAGAFQDLLRILDSELRLITPTDPEGAEDRGSRIEDGSGHVPSVDPRSSILDPRSSDQYYQLTHDYLVPVIREWLTRKQRETWRGRAEVLLEERATQWSAGRSRRLLPSLPECLVFWLAVPRRRRKPPEQALLRAAARHHGLVAGAVLAGLLLLAAGLQHHVAAVRRAGEAQRGETLVERTLNAAPADVPAALHDLAPVRSLVVPVLQSRFDEAPAGSAQQLHAAFALAALGQAPVEFLVECVAGAPVGEARNLIAALGAAAEASAPPLRQHLGQEPEPDRRARYALTLLYFGDLAAAERLLEPAPDPRYRTALIHAFPSWRGDLRRVAARLRSGAGPALRSGVGAALGLVDPTQLAGDERLALEEVLRAWYVGAPDPGTHGAADWALRRWHVELPALPVTAAPVGGREWFLNRCGMTMLRLAPGRFVMGDREPSAVGVREATIAEPFFLSDRETTVAAFQEFVDDPTCPAADKPRDWKGPRKDASPAGDCPVNAVSWYDALLFCNWLSQREGRRPCYLRHDGDVSSAGTAWERVPGADGYRLPTEAEWEYACRAGTTTAYAFGDDPELLPSYGVIYQNSKGRTWPGGSRLPNAWGLFDLYGNVDEWCWDPFAPPSSEPGSGSTGREDSVRRVVRGGHYLLVEARFARSGARLFRAVPEARAATRGFRVVCGPADGSADPAAR